MSKCAETPRGGTRSCFVADPGPSGSWRIPWRRGRNTWICESMGARGERFPAPARSRTGSVARPGWSLWGRLHHDAWPARHDGHCCALPDRHALIRRTHHGIAGLAMKRRRELGHVGQRSVHTPLARCMRVDQHELPRDRGPPVLRPDARPREKEPLLGRESADQRPRFPLERLLQCRERDFEPAQIGNVLVLRELAVDVQGVDRDA